MKFYDLKEKKHFETKKYKQVTKQVKGKDRKFAVAKSPYSDSEYWRILPN